jgi:hypothetical protein
VRQRFVKGKSRTWIYRLLVWKRQRSRICAKHDTNPDERIRSLIWSERSESNGCIRDLQGIRKARQIFQLTGIRTRTYETADPSF